MDGLQLRGACLQLDGACVQLHGAPSDMHHGAYFSYESFMRPFVPLGLLLISDDSAV